MTTLDDRVRELVRDELARLLAEDGAREEARPISDIDRARARAALKRLGLLGAGSERRGAR